MSVDTTSSAPAKSAATPKKAPARWLDDTEAVAIRKLMFRESIDVPGEQGIRSLSSDTKRNGKPQYMITWLPRAGVYLVRATEARAYNGPQVPTTTFTIPESWAIAEHEAL